jgi:hypothetical protein
MLSRPGVRAALLLAIAAAAAAVRLANWGWVLGGDEVRIAGDGDVLYHVDLAGRLVAGDFGSAWRDPFLNFPVGADVPWPPLFASLLAGAGWIAGGGSAPDSATLLAAAVWVPVVLGVSTVLIVARLGSALLGGRSWLDAALILALLPAHAAYTVLGRADQHALEPLVLALILLAVARIARGGGRASAALLGLWAAVAFWNWTGSALYLTLVAGFAAVWHAMAPAADDAPGRAARWMALGLLEGAILLVGSVALLAPSGALGRGSLSGLTGLQPALIAGAAFACALVAAARRWRPAASAGERAASSLAALLVPPALLLALPWSRDALGRGFTMLGALGWYQTITEFRPMLPSGVRPISEDVAILLTRHGLAPLAVVAALPLVWRRWRGDPHDSRGAALLFGVTAAGALGLGWVRIRFAPYLALAEALATALVAREVATRVAIRWPARRLAGPLAGGALAVAAMAPCLPSLPTAEWSERNPWRYSDLQPLARLAARVPTLPEREAVLCPWSDGHDVRYGSRRPVISSPFGIEGGAGALAVDAAFYRAIDQAAVEVLLASRRVGLVLVSEPLDEVVSLQAFAPPDAVPVIAPGPDPRRLSKVLLRPSFHTLVSTRLWVWDGMWGDRDGRPLQEGPPALDGFRLLGEGPTRSLWQTVAVPLYKLFQPVSGALVAVRGAIPGRRVEARTSLRTNQGRAIEWTTWTVAGADGAAHLRLPYAAGLNGAVLASPWRISDGRGATGVAPSERSVLLGESLEVLLGR